jgi:hypothetical protein
LKAFSLLIAAEGVVARDNKTHGVPGIFHNPARLEVTLAHIHRRNPSPGDGPLDWAAHTNFWTLGIGTSVWLTSGVKDCNPSYPPDGINLPILLVDGTVTKSKVVSSSACEIVIELENGHRRRMTPIVAQHTEASEFPGSEWILHEHA